MKALHNGMFTYRGKKFYVSAEDLADVLNLQKGEWVAFDPRKHKVGDFQHIRPNLEDLEKLFPDDYGEFKIGDE